MTLHQQFVQLGRARNKLTYQLLQLLPEIFEQKIYLQYAATIEEYAGKFAGLSKHVVKKRLNLEKYLIGKPTLRQAIEKVGVHKVALIATVATPENQEQLAEDVQHMSKAAIQELSMEIRGNRKLSTTTIELDGETLFLFKKLKQKIANGLSNKESLKRMLEKLAENEMPEPKPRKLIPGDDGESRYISKPRKREALRATSGRCAYPGCNRPSEHFHHRERYASKKSHQSIIPICKIHHEFAHNNLIKNELDSPETWQLQIVNRTPNFIDERYREKRMEMLE